MTRARFVIESPLQLLMANEARFQLELHDSELVILWPGVDQADQTIADVLRSQPWESVIDGGIRSMRSMPARARLIRRLAAQPAAELFVGDYRSPFMRHLLLKQESGSAWLLDDGLATVNTWRIRNEADAPVAREKATGVGRRLVRSLARLSTGHPGHLKFFTFFDLVSTDKDLVVSNELGWLKARLPAGEATGPPLLLGSSFTAVGLMTEDHYVSLVAAVADANPRLQYRPHRRETSSLCARLVTEAGIELISPDGTIELALTMMNEFPSSIASFFSSATLPIYKLVGHKLPVRTYALDPSDFLGDFLEKGDGVPVLVAQSGGGIGVIPIPGRPNNIAERYRAVLNSDG